MGKSRPHRENLVKKGKPSLNGGVKKPTADNFKKNPFIAEVAGRPKPKG